MSKQTMQSLVANILNEEEPTLNAWLLTLSGSGEIYQPEYGQILELSLEEKIGFEELEDTICPIVTAFLHEAVTEDPDVYRDMIMAIKTAHDRFIAWRAPREIVIDVSKDTVEEFDRKMAEIREITDSNEWVTDYFVNEWEERGYLKVVVHRNKKPNK